LAEFWYNTSYHSALGCTSFRVLYGYDAPFTVAHMVMDGCDKSVAELLMDRKAHSDLLKAKLAAAQNRMKM
jgi:hypothetical protein